MSIKHMTQIWEFGPKKTTERFVLLAIADNANDEGLAWPSIATLMNKTQLSERAIQGAIRRLSDEGWLHISAGKGRKNTNLYTLKNPAGDAPPQEMHPAYDDINPADGAENPAGDAPEPSRTIKEPSVKEKNTKKENSKDLAPRQHLETVLSPEIAQAVIDHRKAKRANLTAYAAKLLAQRFAEGAEKHNRSPDDLAKLMIVNGWQGFNAEWVKSNQPKTQQQETPSQRMQREAEEYLNGQPIIDLKADIIPLRPAIAGSWP